MPLRLAAVLVTAPVPAAVWAPVPDTVAAVVVTGAVGAGLITWAATRNSSSNTAKSPVKLATTKVTVRDLPLREQIEIPVREQLIVELYSK